MMKLVNGKPVRLTAEEQTAIEAEWAANTQEAAERQAAMGYRDARGDAYTALLSPRNDRIEALAEMVDALQKKVRALETANNPAPEPDFDDKVVEIDRIKRENPEPPT